MKLRQFADVADLEISPFFDCAQEWLIIFDAVVHYGQEVSTRDGNLRAEQSWYIKHPIDIYLYKLYY